MFSRHTNQNLSLRFPQPTSHPRSPSRVRRMPKPVSRWKRHKLKWSKCRECELCETRKQVVLASGSLPCDVLFVGEAPGVSENNLGTPFIGPAGKLLRAQIEAAGMTGSYKTAFTNLIACIPLGPDGRKIHEPHNLGCFVQNGINSSVTSRSRTITR